MSKKKLPRPRRAPRRVSDVARAEAEPLGLADAAALAISGSEALLDRATDAVVTRGRRLARKVMPKAKPKKRR